MIELDPFERWMVKQNLEYVKTDGVKVVTARLCAQGYNRVADAVQVESTKECQKIIALTAEKVTPFTIVGSINEVIDDLCDNFWEDPDINGFVIQGKDGCIVATLIVTYRSAAHAGAVQITKYGCGLATTESRQIEYKLAAKG